MKSHFKYKKLPCKIEKRDAVCKPDVDSDLKYPSVLRNTAYVGFNGNNLDNGRFIKVNSIPAVGEHLTAKNFVDQAASNSIDETTLVRKYQDNFFKKSKLTSRNSIASSTKAVNDIQVVTQTYVDQFHQEKGKSRRDLGIGFYIESGESVRKTKQKL